MNKRALNIFAAIVLAVFMLLPAVQPAAAEEGKLQIDQIYTNLPEIRVVFHCKDGDETDLEELGKACTLQYKDRILEQEPLKMASEEPLEVRFLIDVSTSMNVGLFDSLKGKLKDLYETKEENATYRLITMGETIKTVLDGSESKEEAFDAIDALQKNNQKSIFWDAVESELTSLKDSPDFARRALFVFTDGAEYDADGETTLSEIDRLLETSGIPVYVFAMDSNSKDIVPLGQIARKSGGKMEQVRTKDELTAGLDKTIEYLSSGYVITAECDDLAQEEGKIIVTLGGDKTERTVKAKAKIDMEPPQIVSVIGRDNELTITYSEPVINADNQQAYTVKREGKEYKVESVRPVVNPKEITLVLEKPLYNGNYTLTAVNITDKSANRNPLSDELFNFAVNDQPYTFKAFLADCWVYLLIAVVVCAGAAAAVVLLRKKKKAGSMRQGNKKVYAGQNPERIRIESTGGKEVMLSISGRNLVRRNVKINVSGTIIIGRLSSCDVSIDDAQVSRQNTALIYQNNKLYVRNLSETNGTMLNGIALRDVREIQPGDTLIMGDTKIVVSY